MDYILCRTGTEVYPQRPEGLSFCPPRRHPEPSGRDVWESGGSDGDELLLLCRWYHYREMISFYLSYQCQCRAYQCQRRVYKARERYTVHGAPVRDIKG